MPKKKRSRPPVYDAEDAALLKSAGLTYREKHAPGTIQAVEQVQPAQRGRITHVSRQERVVKGSDGRIDTCQAAVVQQVHNQVRALSSTAQAGWMDYAELWEAAQPSQSMDYGDRITGGKTGLRDENSDPAWLLKAGELRRLEKRLGRKVARHADNFMRVRETLQVNAMVLAMMEGVGKRLFKAFQD